MKTRVLFLAVMTIGPGVACAQPAALSSWYLSTGFGGVTGWTSTTFARTTSPRFANYASVGEEAIVQKIQTHAASVSALAMGRAWSFHGSNRFLLEAEISTSPRVFGIYGFSFVSTVPPTTITIATGSTAPSATPPPMPHLFDYHGRETNYCANLGWTTAVSPRIWLTLMAGGGRINSDFIATSGLWQTKGSLGLSLGRHWQVAMEMKYARVQNYNFDVGLFSTFLGYDIGAVSTVSGMAKLMRTF